MTLSRKMWTDEQKAFVAANYETMTPAELALRFDRTEASVRSLARDLGVQRVKDRQRWTDKEIRALHNYKNRVSSKEAARKLGRSERSVRSKAARMGITFRIKEQPDGSKHKRWLPAEVDRLWELAENYSMDQVAEMMGRSRDSVKCKANLLGVSFSRGRMTIRQVADLLGVGIKCVIARRDKLGLTFRREPRDGSGESEMRGADAHDVIAIARDLLNDPPIKGLPNTSAKKLRAVIAEYQQVVEIDEAPLDQLPVYDDLAA